MSRRYQLACFVTHELYDAFHDLAKVQHTTVTGLLRRLIMTELEASSLLPPLELERHILFLAIGMDGLLAASEDETLRPRIIEIWRERLEREGFPREA
jgi:hypothetical protein